MGWKQLVSLSTKVLGWQWQECTQFTRYCPLVYHQNRKLKSNQKYLMETTLLKLVAFWEKWHVKNLWFNRQWDDCRCYWQQVSVLLMQPPTWGVWLLLASQAFRIFLRCRFRPLVCDFKLMIVLGFIHSLCATQHYSQVLRVYVVAILWVTENNQRCEQWDAAARGKHQKCGAINNFGCTRSELICNPRDNSDTAFQRPWHRESCHWICPSKFTQCLLAISVTPTCLVL